MNINTVEAGSAIEWYGEGWRLFMKSPGMWIVLGLIYFVISIVLNFIPVVGTLALSLITPALLTGMVYAAHETDQGREPAVEHLFVGLQNPEKRGPMLTLGAIYLGLLIVGFLVVMVLGSGSAIMGGLMGGDFGLGAGAIGGMGMAAILGLILAFLIAMAFIYAGPLVLFHDLGPIPAIQASFNACLQNIVAIIVFDLVTTILAFFASLPFMLGWLLLLPMIFGAIYASYKAILE